VGSVNKRMRWSFINLFYVVKACYLTEKYETKKQSWENSIFNQKLYRKQSTELILLVGGGQVNHPVISIIFLKTFYCVYFDIYNEV